jgi:hypothetical protein
MTNIFRQFYKSFIIAIIFLTGTQVKAQQQLPDSLKQKIAQAKTPLDKFAALYSASTFYLNILNVAGMGEVGKEELVIAQELRNDSLMQYAYNMLGLFFEAKSDYKPSLEFLLKSFHIAESRKNFASMAALTNNISIIYADIKNYTQSLNYLRKSELFCQLPEVKQKRPELIIATHINLGEDFISNNQPDSALKYIQLANAETITANDVASETEVLADFGWVYEKLQQNDLAESYYRKSITYADSLQLLQYIADNAFHFSNFLSQQKRYAEADAMALKSMRAAKLYDYKNGIINAAGVLRNAYFQMNKQDSAYYYANMEVNYRDTVYNEQNLNQMQDMTFSEQVRQTEENQKLTEEHEKAKHNIEYAAITIGIITFIILFLLLTHSIIASARTIEVFGIIGLLITFEFINLVLEPYLISVTNDSPLLMLLALVLVAALLVPAHHYLEEWISHQLVEKNKKLKIAAAHQI